MVTHYIAGHLPSKCNIINNYNIDTVNVYKGGGSGGWFSNLWSAPVSTCGCGYSSGTFWDGLGMGLLNTLNSFALTLPFWCNSWGNNNVSPYAPASNNNDKTQDQIDECLKLIKELREENKELLAKIEAQNGNSGTSGTGSATGSRESNGVTGNGEGGSTKITTIDELLKKTSITEEDLKDISVDDIKKVDKNHAIDILNKLGLIENDDDGSKHAKFSTNYKVLLLLEKSELNVYVAHNAQATDDEGYIRGKISDVKQDREGNITYTVNNKTVSGDYGLTYNFKGKGNTFSITQITNNTDKSYYVLNDISNRNYEYDSTNKYLKFDGTPLTSKWNRDGRTELKNGATFPETE